MPDHPSAAAPGVPAGSPAGRPIQNPKGTRDWYPHEAIRRRFLTELMRRASVLHGFEEVDGPTFEHLDLYTVKSGEGIVSELFSFQRAGGEDTYALRPEFTPTLARMYAARAGSMPRPTKWFSVGPFFRAERPQRGRLREFLQWNVDVLGLEPHDETDASAARRARAAADADAIAACWALLSGCGLTADEVTIAISHRGIVSDMTRSVGIADLDRFLVYLDGHAKRSPEQNERVRAELGLDDKSVERFWDLLRSTKDAFAAGTPPHEHLGIEVSRFDELRLLHQALLERGVPARAIEVPKVEIVRGLAYYTGMVFEVTAKGERAVAGGGRYDGLVELFGGPPTPAVGFGMGDVVLSLLLEDQGLLPEPQRLMELAGVRPDVFVISNGQPESEARLEPVLAALRAAGMHARRSHKSTRNVGKLLKEAGQQHARLVVILEDGSVSTVRDLDARQQREGVMLGDLPGVCATALGRQQAPRR